MTTLSSSVVPPARAVRWLVVTTLTLLGGCAQLPPMPQAPQTLPVATTAPAPPAAPYIIHVGDELAIKMPLNPELNETVRVLSDGTISTSVVQRQMAAGLTLPQLDLALWHDYLKVLKNPVVSAIVVKSAPTPIYLLGEVERPGRYDFEGSIPHLAQAIAVAGGLKRGADDDEIFILRHLPDGRQSFFATKFAALEDGRDPNANVPLAASDEIFIPRTGIARVYGYFNQYFQQFISTSASVDYQVNSNGATSVIPGH
jgi:protein involved in polysaccharide export with SLBB domain